MPRDLGRFYHETDEANKPFLEGLIQLAAAFRLLSRFSEKSKDRCE